MIKTNVSFIEVPLSIKIAVDLTLTFITFHGLFIKQNVAVLFIILKVFK